jgi:hypothetical protein
VSSSHEARKGAEYLQAHAVGSEEPQWGVVCTSQQFMRRAANERDVFVVGSSLLCSAHGGVWR